MHFFNHPLIKIIAQHEVMNDSSLLWESDMDKLQFQIEFKKLISEGHILIGDHDRIYPRFLSLIISDKETGLLVKEIDLAYISANELKVLTGYDEMDEDFIEGLVLKPENKELFEAQNGLKMDFDKYEYCLEVGYANLAYKEPELKRKLTIIHLDDHSLFANAMKIGVKERFFPNSDWKHFIHPDAALSFIEDKFGRNESINIIITDILHPGLNGYEFAKAIRDLEAEYNMFRIPIIVVSICPADNHFVQSGLAEKLFDRYFPKSTEGDIMGMYIKRFIQPSLFS